MTKQSEAEPKRCPACNDIIPEIWSCREPFHKDDLSCPQCHSRNRSVRGRLSMGQGVMPNSGMYVCDNQWHSPAPEAEPNEHLYIGKIVNPVVEAPAPAERVNHGTWSHDGPINADCEACQQGLGNLEIPLKPSAPAEGVEPERLDAAKRILQKACDRDWKDETLYQTAVIASNGIYWRDSEIASLREQLAQAQRERDDALGAIFPVHQLLTNLAQILDVVKGEWGPSWGDWNQEQRDQITKTIIMLERTHKALARTSGGEK